MQRVRQEFRRAGLAEVAYPRPATFPSVVAAQPAKSPRLSPTGRIARALRVVLPLVVLPSGACITPKEHVTYDLVHSLAEAKAVGARLRLDFGASDTRPSMLSGWSWNETAGDGTTFVWAIGEESLVTLTLNGLRPDELRFRAQPVAGPVSAAAGESSSASDVGGVEISIGERSLARCDLAAGFDAYRIGVDPDAWPATEVTLRLRYRMPPQPPIPGAGSSRRLAVAWDWLELGFEGGSAGAASSGTGTASPDERAAPAVRGGRLVLAPSVRLDYAVDLEAGSRLELDRVEPSASALLVVLTPRGGAPRTLRLGEQLGRHVVDLGIDHFTVATLALLADPESLGAGELLVLERPRLVRTDT
jgi:hypothetical protein